MSLTDPRAPAIVSSDRAPTPSRTITHSLDPAFGFRKISITISVPALPSAVSDIRFAEHAYDRAAGRATDDVVAVAAGGVVASDDLGKTWDFIPIREMKDVRMRNVFTCANGEHLLQEVDRPAGEKPLRLFRCLPKWTVADVAEIGEAPWHGSRSIDERRGTIMYAQYPDNGAKYKASPSVELIRTFKNSCVYRSRDNGRSWQKVFELDWKTIRHFHTIAADPYSEKTWWLSSGDSTPECRIWVSRDDGDSWQDVTNPDLDLPLHPAIAAHAQRVYRYTDIVILPDAFIWGSDDWLGSAGWFNDNKVTPERRVGSRMFYCAKTFPLRPQVLGYIGNPIRSIVDVGPAYLVLTEGKHANLIPGPQVYLMSKQEPVTLQQIFVADCFGANGTGFSYSIASRSHRNGCFFSFRNSVDCFKGGPSILRWEVDFE